MKTLTATTIAFTTLTLSTLAIAGFITSFAVPTYAAIADDIQTMAATNENISFHEDGNTITLTGYFDEVRANQRAQ